MVAAYKVLHRTEFTYGGDVTQSQQLLRLTPRQTDRQRVVGSTILIEPAPAMRKFDIDYFGNETTFASVQEPHRRLLIQASSTINVQPTAPPLLSEGPSWSSVARVMRAPGTASALEAAPFCFPSPHIDIPAELVELTHDLFLDDRPLLEATMALTTRIFENFTYKGGVTDVRTPVSHVLNSRQGVCQDFAHLQIACLRYLGLPSRYVSGYLLTHPAPGEEKLVGADESHAWLSVWVPGLEWVDFDPTNNLIPDREHVVLGWGRDYSDVSPINGFIVGGGGDHELDVSVDVALQD